MARWYYRNEGRRTGPLSSEELKRLADQGVLLPDDPVWKEGEAKPRPASAVANLFNQATQPEAPAGGITFIGVLSTLVALVSLALGAGASYLYWTKQYQALVLPMAMLGLVIGNLVLVLDELRRRGGARLAALGVTMSTVSLVTTFVADGGLPRTVADVRAVLASRGMALADAQVIKEASQEEPAKEPEKGPAAPAAPAASPGEPRSQDMTRQKLIAKIEALGNPAPRDQLFQAVGKPQQMRTEQGQLAGLFWSWECKDGTVELVLLNPEVGSGEHTDESMAFISKINEK